LVACLPRVGMATRSGAELDDLAAPRPPPFAPCLHCGRNRTTGEILMRRQQLVPLALLVTFGVACSDTAPIPTDPEPGSAVFNHHGGPGGGGPPGQGGGGGGGGGGPVELVVQVSNATVNTIRGDEGGDYSEYRHGDCIRAVQDGSKLLEFASALDTGDCNSDDEWRGLLFPSDWFENTLPIESVGELPMVDGMRKGAVLNLNVFSNGTFNMWIRAVGSENGDLLSFSKWSISYGTVTVEEVDGWTVVRLESSAAGVSERYGELHHRHGSRFLRWSDRGSPDLPIELRFKPVRE